MDLSTAVSSWTSLLSTACAFQPVYLVWIPLLVTGFLMLITLSRTNCYPELLDACYRFLMLITLSWTNCCSELLDLHSHFLSVCMYMAYRCTYSLKYRTLPFLNVCLCVKNQPLIALQSMLVSTGIKCYGHWFTSGKKTNSILSALMFQ